MSGAAYGPKLLRFYLLFFFCHCVVPQVMFPSGAKVTIQRTSWGLDVYLYTPRAKSIANEKGLCLDPGNQNRDSYGESLRYSRKTHSYIKQMQVSLCLLTCLTSLA